MRRTARDNLFWYRFLPWAVGTAAFFSASSLLFRMLWFDEVLTVNLLMKLPFPRIYFAYEIPNNHIVFTLLEKVWYGTVSAIAGFPYYCFRLVPMFCGAAAIVLLTRKLIRCCGLPAGTLAAGCFAVSCVYALFATAVRGYMTGFLLTVLAVLCAENVVRLGRRRDFLLYFLLTLLSVGTAPTNLAALAAVVLYFLPSGIRRGGHRMRRVIFLAAAPCLALLFFYLPIADKFIGCIRLGEGWHSASSAIYVCYTGMLFPLIGLLPFCAAGAFFIWRKIPRLRLNCICGLLILLLPMAAYGILKVPPFPRVFFPLSAVWLFLAAHAMTGFLHLFRKRKNAAAAVLLIAAAACSFFLQSRMEAAGSFLYDRDGRGDDYIAPYYARASFVPNKLLEYLKEKYRKEGEFRVFATFDSDAPSLVFAGMIADFPEGVLLADALNRPKTLRLQDYPGEKYIICAGEADLEQTLRRFGLRSAVLEKKYGLQHLYRVRE